MPTYDFFCNDCNQRFDMFLTYAEYGKAKVTCAHCQSKNVRRRMTRVRIAKSDDSRLESITGDLNNFEALERDPQAMGKMMRKMSKEVGEDLPPEFNEVVDRLEAGQSPDEIESAVPEVGGASDE